MASSLDMSLDDRIKNMSNRGRGRGRARSGCGSRTLGGGRVTGAVNGRRLTGPGNGGRTAGVVSRGPLMVNTRPSSFDIAKSIRRTKPFPMQNDSLRAANFRHVHQLFDKMPHRNVVTWTTLISSHLKNGSLLKAFKMFNHMRALDEIPNEYTFSILLRACANSTFLNVGLQIHGLHVHCGIERDKFAGSSLVYMHFKGGNDLRGAWCVFYGLLERDVVAWSVMISGFARVGDFCMVQWLFSELGDVQGLKPDNSTFVSLIKCCSLLQEVKQIHGLVYKFGAEVDVMVILISVTLRMRLGHQKWDHIFGGGNSPAFVVAAVAALMSGLLADRFGRFAIQLMGFFLVHDYFSSMVPYLPSDLDQRKYVSSFK